MAKDRAAPFSRKHRRYWLTVTGGMVVIGILDLTVGFVFWPHHKDENAPPQQIHFDVPQVGGEWATLIDAAPPDPAVPTLAPAPSAPPPTSVMAPAAPPPDAALAAPAPALDAAPATATPR